MEGYVELSDLGAGKFGLPVIGDFFTRKRAITDSNGIQHPANIWTVWSDKELVAIGYARATRDDIPNGKRLVAWSAPTFKNSRVTIKGTFEDIPPPPPNPDQYKIDRKNHIAQNIGSGNFDEAIGQELDALCRWITKVRMQQTAVADATTLDELKAAVAPILNVPQELDDVLGVWTAAKAAYPKPK